MDKFTFAHAMHKLSIFKTDYGGLFERDTFDLGFYQPKGADLQTPHSKDELYFIASGSGKFICGNEMQPFSTGDVFFVPAGVAHKFVDFSNDFAAWVVFFKSNKRN